MNNKTKTIGLKAYLSFLRPHWLKIIFVLSLATASNILLAVVPLFVGQLVQTLGTQPINTSEGWLYAWILVALSSLHDVLWRAFEFSYRGLIMKIPYDYETHLFRSVIKKPYPYFVDKMTGKVGSYITTITTEFRNLLENLIFDTSGRIVSIVAALLIFGSLNWQTGVVFLAGIVGMFAVGRYTLAYNMKYESRATDVASSKNGILYDAIANYTSVKAFHAEDEEARTIAGEQQKTYQANRKAFLSGIVFWGSMSLFVRHFIWTVIVLMNVYFFFHGQLTIGQLATLFSTALIFSETVWAGVWQASQFGQQLARVNEAYYYLFGSDTQLLPEQTSSQKTLKLHDAVEISNLSFAYPDKPGVDVLRNVSLSIRRGEKVGIVGRSGSGKSTLTKLLLDFYPLPEGSLKVDGKAVDIHDFSKLISYVPQDTALFHRSIAANIAYGAAGPAREEIEQAAKQASADEFIETLTDGYETLVGERGVKLSGGQRQRIAIARAILQNKPVLILDEATSALDSESEIKVQHALGTLWKGKTVIAIAHRLSTLRHMDTIIVMEKGEIIERGSHEELLAQHGVYAKLWSHQSGGFIEE